MDVHQILAVEAQVETIVEDLLVKIEKKFNGDRLKGILLTFGDSKIFERCTGMPIGVLRNVIYTEVLTRKYSDIGQKILMNFYEPEQRTMMMLLNNS